VEGAGVEAGELGGGEKFAPEFAAAQGELEKFAGGLADGPDHAEVADGGSRGSRAALEDDDALPRFGGGPGVGEAENACADDSDVCCVL